MIRIPPVDFILILQQLHDAGLTDVDIANETGIQRTSIVRARSEGTGFSHHNGETLLTLHRIVCLSAPRKMSQHAPQKRA